jgi:hypothetical protein
VCRSSPSDMPCGTRIQLGSGLDLGFVNNGGHRSNPTCRHMCVARVAWISRGIFHSKTERITRNICRQNYGMRSDL